MIFIAKKWQKFSKEELETFVKESTSLVGIARKIGYNDNGGSCIKEIHNMIDYYNFDTGHLLGQGWNKNNYDYERLRNGVTVKSSVLKRILVSLRGEKCEQCGVSIWNNQIIPLEVHHEDGDVLNNTLENIHLLCPNCHATTDNWRKPKMNNVSDEILLEALHKEKNIRQALLSLGMAAKGANYNRAKKLLDTYKQ